MSRHRISIGELTLEIQGDLGPFSVELSESSHDGVSEVEVRLTADRPAQPPRIELGLVAPIVDMHVLWHPDSGQLKKLPPHWGRSSTSSATQWAPIVCFASASGRNRLTSALSDALNPIEFRGGVHEETATVELRWILFTRAHPETQCYTARLRLDMRPVAYSRAVAETAQWWAKMPGFEPSSPPEHARLPMYSTWYGFHQRLAPDAIEAQCRLAKAIGCESVIVDDGWQTADDRRGYSFTGDWQVAPERIPDMRAHVARVHELGMKYLLWYAVPFVGGKSKAFERFEHQFLWVVGEGTGDHKGTLDPRFPEVREYLIQTYERGLSDWDLDGFKLDFVDCFAAPPGRSLELEEGQDMASVAEATDRLLSDVMARLRARKPDVMVEFRQSYVGPLMRKYGNMFRAWDCPNDFLQNRISTLDVRLLAGNTATHSDMLMWHPSDRVESAALQLVNVLFAVPQISVLLDRIPPEHTRMLGFWLGVWRAHRDVLLDGVLSPEHPELNYPLVQASAAAKHVCAWYDDRVGVLPAQLPQELLLVNGTLGECCAARLPRAATVEAEIFDCTGRSTTASLKLSAGLNEIRIPPAGLASLRF